MGSRTTSTSEEFKRAPFDLLRRAPNEETNGDTGGPICTVLDLIDFNAEQNPDWPFCLQATTTRATPIEITQLQFKQAIVRCSTRLKADIAQLKAPCKDAEGKFVKCQPVALFVESDVGLLIHLFALMSLSIPVALLSARLSPVAVHHLLTETRAEAIIASPRLSNTIKNALSHSTASGASQIAPAVYLQKPYEFDLQPADRSRNRSEVSYCNPSPFISETDRNVLILHSSGTTGLPKPIYQSHRYLLGYTVCHQSSSHEDSGGLNMSTLPLYHGFGLLAACLSIGIGKPFWLAPAHVVPTGASTVDALRSSQARSLMTVPFILEEISMLPENQGAQALLPLQFVACGGGPLKVSVGEKLAAAGVKVLAHFGATEVGPMAPIFAPTPDYDWHYFRLRQDMHFKLEQVDSEGSSLSYKLTAQPFGWETPFELQDRLINSPEHPKTDFKAVGRNDDLIVLVTGEKVLPRILESLLSESQLVKAAVVFGDGQFELGVIVEPALPPEDNGQFKSNLWPIILKAGEQMDDHAQISSKTSIIIAPPERPIPRSDKGSVLRREAYRVFEAEISQVYRDLNGSAIGTYHSLDVQNLEESLRNMIHLNLNWTIPAENLHFDDDFFELGMNSLQALHLRRLLHNSVSSNAAFLSATDRITLDFVYKNSSIAKIAKVLKDNEGQDDMQTDRGKTVDDFVNFYSLSDPSVRHLQDSASATGSVVLLTGSTGSLGTHLLAQLASLPSVVRVICLNRLPVNAEHHKDPYKQQFNTAETKGVTISLEDRLKIDVIQTDPAARHLGLKDAEYAHLCNTVTHILHCAWPMDFKRTLPSFETQFRFLQNLLNLANKGHEVRPLTRVRLLFVSSIAVVGQYSRFHGRRIVPEVPMKDEGCTNHFGYGKAKLVCEKMVENAARTHQKEMELLCVRVGQMSGSLKSGFWNPNEHFPALVQLSQKISKFPIVEGTLSWAPVDSTAKILSELLLTRCSVDLVYHVENPVRQSWHDILTTLASTLNISSTEFLPFDDWLDHVGALSAKNGTTEDQSAATMLAEFFRQDFQHMSGGEVILGTDRAQSISATLRGMDAVTGDLVASYVDHWRRRGFLT